MGVDFSELEGSERRRDWGRGRQGGDGQLFIFPGRSCPGREAWERFLSVQVTFSHLHIRPGCFPAPLRSQQSTQHLPLTDQTEG